MNVRHTILAIDDEPQILRFLRHSLAASGYALIEAETAAEGLQALRRHRPDLVILDLGLPDLDGKAVVGEIRQTDMTPIIVLSAREQESEKIAALDLGADDFVAKPFGIGELLARIRVCLRSDRNPSGPHDRLVLGDLIIDIAAHQVERNGARIRLTPKEFELFGLLARNAGKVLTHRHILRTIWGAAHVEDTPYLRVLVGQLRQKVEENPAEPRLILTEPGVGYRATAAPS